MLKPIALALTLSALASTAAADQVFICTSANTSLHFVLYEDASGMRGGHMYINNIQAATLTTTRVNNITVRGTVDGNTAGTELVFNSSRQAVYIEIGSASELVCDAQVNN